MTSFTVHCTHCDTAFPVDPEKVPDGGVRARCTNCEGIFFVASPAPAAAPAPVAEPAPETPEVPPAPAAPEPDDAGFGSFDDELEGADPAPISGGIAAPTSEPIEAPDVDEVDAVLEEVVPDESPEAAPMIEEAPPEPTPAAMDETSPAAEAPHAGVEEAPPEVEEVEPAFEDVQPEAEEAPPQIEEAPTELEEAQPEIEETQPEVEAAPPEIQDAPPEIQAAPPELEHEAPAVPTGFQFGKRDPHEKARRLARVLVSDMITYNADRHAQALARGTLAEDFEDEIGKSWQEYVDQVGLEMAESTPYWNDALNAVLAKGNEIF